MENRGFDVFDGGHGRAGSVCEENDKATSKKNEDDDSNNLRHRRATSTPAQYTTTVDTLSSSKPGNQRLPSLIPRQAGFGSVTEWIDGATIQTIAENVDGKASQASTGFVWSLYHHTLGLFSLLFPLILTGSIPGYNRQREKSFKKSLGRLFLWGDGFREGKLESVLDESEGLRETVIESLAAIGKILLFKLAPKCLENSTSTSSSDPKIMQEIHDLEILVEKARILTENEYESDESSILTSSESSESFSLGIANTLKVYVECLMELLPSMEETLSALEYDEFEDQPNHPIDFQVSGPAQPYVLKVYDKFPKADLRLMHRLGEANWQRHMSLRKMDNQIEDDEIPQEIPKAVFTAVSLFHDSGLGSSLQAQSTYAATIASHSSFQSTAADKDNGDLRVPPTPKQVFEGVPFSCQICGHMLTRIKNRIDWRRHVFVDLKPYLCTFSSCKDEMKTFPTRKLWEEHEFSQHRMNRYWSCSACQHKASTPEGWRTHLEHTHGLHLSDDQYQVAASSVEVRESIPVELESCPLCLEVPGKSRRNFATHVGKHMEAIALAAVPREAESTDSESIVSSVSSTTSRRQLTESRRDGEPVNKRASRVLSSQSISDADEEEDDYKLSRKNHGESSDSSNLSSKEAKEGNQDQPLYSCTSLSHPQRVPQRPELKSVPDLDNLDNGNRTNSNLPSGPIDTPVASGPSLSTQKGATKVEAHPELPASISNLIHDRILKPLLAKASLKDFHPIVGDCPRRIHSKEIECLRDLEKTLIFMAPERSKTAALYLDFCLTSIRLIQWTVEFLSDAQQTRPHDRPYTNGYFIDLVEQVKQYAQQLQEATEKQPRNDLWSEDAKLSADDEIKLHGGLAVNGKPAELIRVKKNGEAFFIATGLPVDLSENTAAGIIPSRSLSEQAEDEVEIMASMARRKRSATDAELAPKKCREPGCNEEFKRPCDLTKHEKTHSRPWKCPIESCKYHDYGWPTEKEMHRHFKDKHTVAHPLYECHFKPCPYKSKRESNCKQHMEKAHRWVYTRSKNGKKNVTADALPHLEPYEPIDKIDSGYQDDSQGFSTIDDFELFPNDYLLQNDLNAFSTSLDVDPIPHLSPIGRENAMLFTPTALQDTDEGFEDVFLNNTDTSSDFQLFPPSKVELTRAPHQTLLRRDPSPSY